MGNENQECYKMIDVSPILSVISLSVNGLSTAFQRQRLVEWVKNNMIKLYALYEEFTLNPKTQIDLK